MKKTIFDYLPKAIGAHIPGTSLNVALEKRKSDRELRNQGLPRKAAKAETSRRFSHD